MHVALIIGGSIIGVGVVLYLHNKFWYKQTEVEIEPTPMIDKPAEDECCGMHIVCERDSLSMRNLEDIVYFEDEELDDYKNYDPTLFKEEDIEKFRDVLLTLLPEDVIPWAQSIQQRGITLPQSIRDELYILIEEHRQLQLNPL